MRVKLEILYKNESRLATAYTVSGTNRLVTRLSHQNWAALDIRGNILSRGHISKQCAMKWIVLAEFPMTTHGNCPSCNRWAVFTKEFKQEFVRSVAWFYKCCSCLSSVSYQTIDRKDVK